MPQRQQRQPTLPSLGRCVLFFALFFVVTMATQTVHGYDFTNLGAAERKRLHKASNGTLTKQDNVARSKDNATLTSQQQSYDDSERHVVPSQTPIHWFFNKLYNIQAVNATTNATTSVNTTFTNNSVNNAMAASNGGMNSTSAYTFVRLPTAAGEMWRELPDEKVEDEAVKYNVSFLGLKDPFARYATKLSYDYRIDVGEPSKNGRGSIVSLLNGTIYPLGSVGAMSAVGWSGGTNETRSHSSNNNSSNSATPPSTAASRNGTSTMTTTTTGTNSTDKARTNTTAVPASTGTTTSVTPHSDGMTGIWLAFTSQHAVTGGYTMHAKHVSVTNNVLFHNVTFRSNFTIDAHGRFTFVFTLGTVDESDQMTDDDGDGILTKSNTTSSRESRNSADSARKGTHATGAVAKPNLKSSSSSSASSSSPRPPPVSPIRLDGPHCTPMQGTHNTEAAFRMRCEGVKVDTST